MSCNGWIGVDLDGTLAHYDGWKGPEHIGEPVPLMAEKVRVWLAEGKDVRIFTARIWPLPEFHAGSEGYKDWEWETEREKEAAKVAQIIRDWTEKHFGTRMTITSQKDYGMIELWDDRAVQVIPNTGRRADGLR